MGGSDSTTVEDIPLPKRNSRKPHDFAEQTQDVGELTDAERTRLLEATTPDKSDSDTTASESETEFDWEAEDDALSTRAPNTEANVKRGRRLWKAYMRLSRPLRTFIVAAIGSSILITPLIIFRVRFYSSPAQIQAHVWSLWLALTWAAACATYLIVDLAPLLALAVFRALGHKAERIQITVELTKAVLGWLKLALDVSWAWISLSVIRAVYKPPGSYWTVINRVLEGLFSAAILLLVEKICLQYVAINFHRRALADRIEVNQVALRALDRLQNATPATVRRAHEHRQRGHRMGTLSGSGTLDSGATSGSGSPVGEKREEVQLEKAMRGAKNARKGKRHSHKVATVLVDGLGGAINQMAFKNTDRAGKMVYSANKLARKLFSRLGEGDNLMVDDFLAYFDSVSDAKAAFEVFDKDSNGDISKREMRDAVRRIYKERRALTASLKDVSSVVAKLDAVLISVALMILIFICLLIFSRNNTLASLVPLATIVVGFSFIFGHSAQTLFESLIFIFSTHVFDVGDLVMIDDSPMFVVEFGLFSTTFKRVDGQTVIAPNALLASSKAVHNLRRSSSMWETTELQVGFDTPLEVLERLKVRLEEYVKDDLTGREWSRVSLHIKQMDNQNAITLVVGMEHRPNWQDWGGRWQRRTEFMRHLKTCLEELDVRYTKPVQPVLLPYAPAPGGGGVGGARNSPTALSPSFQLRQPSIRLSPGHSRETLAVRRSRDSLGRVGSVRGAQVGRAPSHRSLRPQTDRAVS